MSRASVTVLIQRLKADPDFAATVMAIADPAKRMEFLTASGYSVSPGEFDTYGRELDDASLDAVSGGGTTTGVTMPIGINCIKYDTPPV